MMIGGKPGTIVITKPGTPPTTAISGKPASAATIAQLIQAGGKPTTIAGTLQSFRYCKFKFFQQPECLQMLDLAFNAYSRMAISTRYTLLKIRKIYTIGQLLNRVLKFVSPEFWTMGVLHCLSLLHVSCTVMYLVLLCIFISFLGKPIMIGGKPAYLSGKPIQLIGKSGQIGVLASGQGQQVLSNVSLVSQVGCFFCNDMSKSYLTFDGFLSFKILEDFLQ